MLNLEGEINCPNCCHQYKDNNVPRILTMCGHTFCSVCIEKLIKPIEAQQQGQSNTQAKYIIACPEDNQEMQMTHKQIKAFPKNIALLKMLENKKKHSSFKDQSFDLSKIVKQQEIQQDDETKQLITAMKQGKRQSYQTDKSKNQSDDNQSQLSRLSDQQQEQQKSEDLISEKAEVENSKSINQQQMNQGSCENSREQASQNNQNNQHESQICLLHQKPLEIVCILDRMKICSKCAIFGEHKGHQFKSIQQVEQQTKQQYIKILNIFQQKQAVEQRMSNEETKKELVNILIQKKDRMKKQIKLNFKKLFDQIAKQQNICIKALQKESNETQEKIKKLLKINPDQLQLFNEWEENSYQKLKILESTDLQAKIELLYQIQERQTTIYKKQQRKKSTIKDGQNIIDNMTDQQNNLITQVEQILQNLEYVQDDKIINQISNFMYIRNQPILKEDPYKVDKSKSSSIEQQKSIAASHVSIADQLKIQSQQFINDKNFESLCPQGSPLLEESLLDINQDQQTTHLTEFNGNYQNDFNNFNQASVYHKIQDKVSTSNPQLMNTCIVSLSKQDSFSDKFSDLSLQSTQKVPKDLKRISSKKSILTKNKVNLIKTEKFIDNQNNIDNVEIGLETCKKEDSNRVSIGRKSLAIKNPNLLNVSRVTTANTEKPTKKKLKSIKVPQKYQKVLQGIYNNALDTIDLTNAQLGDAMIQQVCEFIKYSTKTKTIKLIRNKLSDNGISKILPFLTLATTLNLSQNNLTDNCLDIFIENLSSMVNLKNLILSQNKIIERKHRAKIQQLKSMGVVVSV